MTESKKKKIEITIIVVGMLFLTIRFVQNYIATRRFQGEIRIEIPANFNLEEAKRSLTNIGGIKDRTEAAEKHIRDILRKPDELTALEHKPITESAAPGEISIEEPMLSLEGVMTGGSGGNLAIISGKVVAEGDTIGSAKVFKIDPGRVILIKNGSQIELKR